VPNALADVYSLGIVLFMIVVGYHPYLSQAALHMPLKDFVEELLSNTYQIPKLLMHYSLEFG
jgi:serine/threonine protein kinase